MIKEKYITREEQIAVNISGTKVDSVRKTDISRTGIRIYDNNLIGVAGGMGNVNEAELEKKAKDSLASNIPYPYEPSSNNNTEEIISNPKLISEDKFVVEIEEVLEYFRKNYSDFIFSNKCYIGKQDTKLVNNKNLNLHHLFKYIAMGMVFKEKASANIADGFITYIGKKYDRKTFLKFSDSFFNAYRNKMDLPAEKKYPVVFTWTDPLPMIKLFRELNGLLFGSGGSLLSEKRGKKVFNENFTLYQNYNPENTLTPFFDAEGVVNKNYKYALVENGTIITPYTDKKISKMFNLPLTGSASAEYDGVPNLNYINMMIKESEKSAKELLGGEQGIFILIAAGGDFTPEGNFASPVQLAMFYDGEKFIGKLPELKLSSNVFDMYGKDFRGVSKNHLFPLGLDKLLIMDVNVSKI